MIRTTITSNVRLNGSYADKNVVHRAAVADPLNDEKVCADRRRDQRRSLRITIKMPNQTGS